MRRATQNTLYHLLPVAFWLLAAGGIALWAVLAWDTFHFTSLLPGALMMLCWGVVSRIRRHASSIEECFQVALLLGIASYWLPSVVFLILPIWGYLIYRNLFSFRSLVATLLGFAVVAVWAAVLVWLGWIVNPWFEFFATKNLWAWIPTGSFLIAFIASTIARQTLRVR